MQQYLGMMEHVMANGVDKQDRTGTGTRSVFGYQMRFDLAAGFPMVTAKFIPFRLVATELLWFLRGNPDIRYLHEHNNHIWDEWVKADGTFGPIYGQQWRSWPSYHYVRPDADGMMIADVGPEIDQLANVIERLKTDPDNRRLIVSAWNVAAVESGEMALPPCHAFFQFYSAPMGVHERFELAADMDVVDNELHAKANSLSETDRTAAHALMAKRGVPGRKLSCQLYQRSADTFLGVPFNIASYSLLTHMIAQVTNHAVGDFVWTGGDVHIYSNHFDQVKTILDRQPLSLPELVLDPTVTDIDTFTIDHMRVEGYNHHGKVPAPVAV